MIVKLMKQIVLLRSKSFIVIAVLLIANIGLYIYSSAFQKQRLSALQTLWFEKRSAKERGSRVDTASVYRQGTADLAAWRARIAPKKDFARVIGELFELARNNSLSVGAITYKPAPIKEENLLTYSIGFNVSGKYSGIKSFLADIICSREIMTVDNISLNSTRPTEESVDLKVQLTIYFSQEEK